MHTRCKAIKEKHMDSGHQQTKGAMNLRLRKDTLACMKIKTQLQGVHKRLGASRQYQEFGCKN